MKRTILSRFIGRSVVVPVHGQWSGVDSAKIPRMMGGELSRLMGI